LSLNIDLTIALDVMGGDQGPFITISSAIMAINQQSDLHLILCGDEPIITATLASFNISQETLATHKQLSIFPTSQVVLMSDKPIVALIFDGTFCVKKYTRGRAPSTYFIFTHP
jgi:glycerol-3-phosphate acyltransferase PlsX